MKRLLIYLEHYKKETILAPLFKMLEASFELFIPLVMAAIIDVGIANRNRGYIVGMCGIMVLLGVIGLVCSITAQYYSAKAAVGFAAKMKHAMFAHIQKLSFSQMDQVGNSTLITRMTSDANQVQSGVNLVLRLFLRSPFIVFGAMVMAFTIDVPSALVFVVTIPLLCVVVFGIMLWTMPLYKKVQARLDQILTVTRENLTGVRVLRAFNKEEAEKVRFQDGNQELTRMQMFVGRISALMNPVTFVIINGAVIALIWSGALRVDAGAITQGEVVALVSYMSQILVELIKLANLIVTVTKAFASASRIEAVFLLPVREEESRGEEGSRGTEEEAVVFHDVSLTYPGAGGEALSHISFRALKGQTIGIIGGTGSGKSSLVNLLPRFYEVTGGKVCLFGKDLKDYPVKELRQMIGMVMQKAVLFKGTIRENLLWGKEAANDGELWEALRIAQAEDFVKEKEGQLDASISQSGKNLSGGQKQRLTIARAIVRKPRILILDDSASALDYATDARLRAAIRKMEGETTVFIVSQRAASIRHADQIIVLEDGEMAAVGTHEELLKSCSVYQEIYDSQFGKEERA